MNSIVFFDLETGGLSPESHPIIQLAAAAVDWRTLEVLDELEVKLLFDESQCTEEALRINSYDAAVWREQAIPSSDAALAFADLLRAHAHVGCISARGKPYYVAQMAAYCADFDMSFLRAWFDRENQFLPAAFRPLCVMQRAQWHCLESGERPADFKLTTVAEFFGLVTAGAHDASIDNRRQIAIYRKLRAASRKEAVA